MHVVNPAARLHYILKADRDSPKPTTFFCRRLSRAELLEFGNRAGFDAGKAAEAKKVVQQAKKEGRALTEDENAIVASVQPKDAESMREARAFALELGLEEIIDLEDMDGKPIKVGVPDFVRLAPDQILWELVEFLISISWGKPCIAFARPKFQIVDSPFNQL